MISITEMNLSDLEEIKDILTIDFDDFWNYKTFKSELESTSSKYFLARDESKNEIVGFAGIKIILGEADIMNIVTKKTCRNQGIGTALLKKIINVSIELNLKTLTLEVNEENLKAISLYKKFGFKEIGSRKNYYKDKNAIIMTKKSI